jgi:sterol 3beta-glucosyltransferase
MKVALITVGSRGDVQPYVALAAGLGAAGHDAWVATFPGFETFVRQHGVGFRPLPNALRELSVGETWRRWQASANRPLQFSRGLHDLLRDGRASFIRMFNAAWTASDGADLILYPTIGLGGPDIAEKRGIPGVWAHLYPTAATSEFPCFMTPAWLRLRGWTGRATYQIASVVYRHAFGPALDEFRRTTLSLPPRRRAGAFNPFGACEAPVLYGYSPTLVPRPADWSRSRHVTGDWYLDSPREVMPPELDAWLGSVPRPVFVNAVALEFDATFVRGLAEALPRATGAPVLIQASGGERIGSTSRAFITSASLPHGSLFPRVRAVVHHGGAGTSAAVLRAGVPSIGVPGFFDQPFWSQRLTDLGAAATPLPRRRATVERLVRAVTSLLVNPQLQARADALAAAVRTEAGVTNAVEILSRHGRG